VLYVKQLNVLRSPGNVLYCYTVSTIMMNKDEYSVFDFHNVQRGSNHVMSQTFLSGSVSGRRETAGMVTK